LYLRETVNHSNILKLNGINEYPVYTLGEITLLLFENKVTFHIVLNNFPITQSGILDNDFSKILLQKLREGIFRYIRNYYTLFFSTTIETTTSPRSESSFYVKIGKLK